MPTLDPRAISVADALERQREPDPAWFLRHSLDHGPPQTTGLAEHHGIAEEVEAEFGALSTTSATSYYFCK